MRINAETLKDYLKATSENATDHAVDPPQLMFLVEQMEEIFHQEIFALEYNATAYAGLLAMNAYTLLLSAVRQALSGHVVSVFPVVRSALESACYGFLIGCDEVKGDIWMRRHDSKESLKMSRRTITVDNAVKEMERVNGMMAEYIQALYAAAIDFGAHPNPQSVFHHLEDSGQVGSEHAFSLAGVYGHNSWQVNHKLLACVEYGQAVAFLIAASGKDHSLLTTRLEVFTEWMDAKNRMVVEINGEPMNYTGPMYCSVLEPG